MHWCVVLHDHQERSRPRTITSPSNDSRRHRAIPKSQSLSLSCNTSVPPHLRATHLPAALDHFHSEPFPLQTQNVSMRPTGAKPGWQSVLHLWAGNVPVQSAGHCFPLGTMGRELGGQYTIAASSTWEGEADKCRKQAGPLATRRSDVIQ